MDIHEYQAKEILAGFGVVDGAAVRITNELGPLRLQICIDADGHAVEGCAILA